MSCMSFGEINIPSSRAFWDDCDEDEIVDATNETKLSLTYEPGQENVSVSSDFFFIIEGTHILHFAEKTLLSAVTKVCTIPSKKSALYRNHKKNTLLAIIEEDLNNSGEVSELLRPFSDEAQHVNTLTIKPIVDYKSEDIADVREEITFLRGINSQHNYVDELKAPNFIAGVSAGIASWRESKELPVSSYIAYTDKISLDNESAELVLRLIKDLGIDCAASYNAKFKDNSHLYM